MAKVKDVALVLDKDDNELFFGESIGECQVWCKEHTVTGYNGEYIVEGLFDEEQKSFKAGFIFDINPNWNWRTK